VRFLRYGVLLVLVATVVFGLRHINAGGSQTYTGCLNSSGGLSRVQIGTFPTKPCDEVSRGPALLQVSWESDPPAGPDGSLGLEGQSCPAGEALVGFNESGGLVCDAP
jgi:hypothetical protein